MNGWTGDSSTGNCGAAGVSWRSIKKTTASAGQPYTLWQIYEQQNNAKLFMRMDKKKNAFFPMTKVFSFLPSVFKFYYNYVSMFCVSNDEVNLRRSTKTKHSPGIRTIADFASCRTKPSSLLIYFLQFLPQTVTSHPIPHPPVASHSFGWCESSSEALNILIGKPKWEERRSQTDVTELIALSHLTEGLAQQYMVVLLFCSPKKRFIKCMFNNFIGWEHIWGEDVLPPKRGVALLC